MSWGCSARGGLCRAKGNWGPEVELGPNSRSGESLGPTDLPGLVGGLPEPRSGPRRALTLTLACSTTSHLRTTDLGGMGRVSHSTGTQPHIRGYTYTHVHVLTACLVR